MELVSILMSTFNEEDRHLRASIESILGQTYTNIELIIVCDNPDNERLNSIVYSYAEKDDRVRLIKHEENVGLAKSLNDAFSESQGNYIARMDADDISMPDRIYSEYKYLSENPNVDLVCSAVNYIDDDNKEIALRQFYPQNDEKLMKSLNFGSIIMHPTVMFRREIFTRVGGYNNYLAAQDYDLWLKMREAGAHFHYMNDCLLAYRKRVDSVTEKNALIQALSAHFIRQLFKRKGEFNEKEYEDYIDRCLSDQMLRERFNSFLQAKKLKNINDYVRVTTLAFVDGIVREKMIKDICFLLFI